MNAPIAFYDTTPLGRIMNRLSKGLPPAPKMYTNLLNSHLDRVDVDTIDNILGDAIRMFIGTLAQIVGAIVLVSIVQPYFLIAVTVILIAYYWVGIYYRPSAREIRVRIHPSVYSMTIYRTPNRGWTRCSDRRCMRTFRNPSTVCPRFGLTERPHGSVPKMLQGWMSRIGVWLWLAFVGFGRTDGRSEVPTGCQLQLNDGSVFG
jgi:hypothetical protein